MRFMLTVSQVSQMLNIKASTIYAWVAQDKIPHVKIHGLIRFHPQELSQWIDSFKTTKPLQPELPKNGLDKGFDYLESLIARAKREAYTRLGETRPNRALK